MKTGWSIALGIVIGLLAAGAVFLASRLPRGEAIRLLPPPTALPIVVYVSGAVNTPGVYYLPVDSRVQDAIFAAGGMNPEAQGESLNLAKMINDGERIHVPYNQEQEISQYSHTPETGQNNSRAQNLGSPVDLININTATLEELESLPGIGPVLARRIIAYRQAYGNFVTIEDILVVYGINAETFELIKGLITVQSEP